MRSYACLFVLSVSMASSLSAAALKAGAAVVDITPTQFPVNMPGGHSSNMATGVDDHPDDLGLPIIQDQSSCVQRVMDPRCHI